MMLTVLIRIVVIVFINLALFTLIPVSQELLGSKPAISHKALAQRKIIAQIVKSKKDFANVFTIT